MKCENDAIEIYINDSVKLIETSENKTYIKDRWLQDTEIIDRGLVLDPDEDVYDELQVTPNKSTPSPENITSSTRENELESSVETIDVETYIPKDNTKKSLGKTVINRKSVDKNRPKTRTDDRADKVVIVDVKGSNSVKEDECKDKKKPLSLEHQKKQTIQQSIVNKEIDLKKNQGLVGKKVIRSSVDTKQRTNKKYTENNSLSKEKESKKTTSIRVTKEIFNKIRKQTQIPKYKNVNHVNGVEKTANLNSLSELLAIEKKKILKDLKNLKSTLYNNKNIVSKLNSQKVLDVCDNKTQSTNVPAPKNKQRITQNGDLNNTLKNKEAPKITSQNSNNIDVTNMKKKKDSPQSKTRITPEEYQKEKGNCITKKDTEHRKEENQEIIKPTISKRKVTSGPQNTKFINTQDSQKITKLDHQTLTNTKYKNKSSKSFPNPNKFTDNVKKLLERKNKEPNKTENHYSLEQGPVQFHNAVSLDYNCETNFLNKTEPLPAVKSGEPDTEVPKVSINIKTTIDNRFEIEIIKTSPKVPKPLVSDPLVLNPEKANPLTPIPLTSELLTPKPVVSNTLAPKALASDPLVPNPQMSSLLKSDAQVLNPSRMPKTKTPRLQALKQLVKKQIAPNLGSNGDGTLVPMKISSMPPLSNTEPLATEPVESNLSVPKSLTPHPRSPKSQAIKPLSSDPNLHMSKISQPQDFNSLVPRPLAPISRVSYTPLVNPLPLSATSKPQVPKSLVSDKKQVLNSNSTFLSDETSKMIERAVFEYKLRKYYAQKDPIDLTETARIPQHPPTSDLKNKKNKKPVKILSVEDIGKIYMPKQQDYKKNQPITPKAALQNMSKYPQSESVTQKHYPIQRLVTERKDTPYKPSNMAPNFYQYNASQAAKIYAQHSANVTAVNDPRLQFGTYGPNMPCMPQGFPDTRTNFTTHQNINIYQQPNIYAPYDLQYYPPGMQNYYVGGYNTPSQTAYNHYMGGPVYAQPPPPPEQPPPPRPPPPPYPSQPPNRRESIIGKNNDGVIKKINISAQYNSEPPKLEIKDEVKEEKCEETQSCNGTTITPVSTKTEMQKELDSCLLTDTARDVSVIVTTPNLKRPYESLVSNGETKRTNYLPCPLSKKFKPNDPLRTPEQKGDEMIKNTEYSPPILPIPPTFDRNLSTFKHQDTNCFNRRTLPRSNVNCSQGLANLLQLNDDELGKVLEKSGYRTMKLY